MIKKNNRRAENAGTSFYSGKIEKYFFTLLIDKIKESNLKNLDYEITTDCSNCDQMSLIVEFKDKTFKHEQFGQSPIIIKDLVEYLNSLSQSIKLEKSD